MKYNIIGDVHCRQNWKQLLREDCINVFVGDYFAPYRQEFKNTKLTFDYEASVFYDIMDYKAKQPETITLIGNHDLEHWKLLGKDFTYRFDDEFAHIINQIFNEFEKELQIVALLDGKGIVTHAGVSAIWYENMINGGFKNYVMDLRYNDDDNDFETALDNYHNEIKSTGRMFRNTDPYMLFRWYDGFYKISESGEVDHLHYNIKDVYNNIINLWNQKRYNAFKYMTASPRDSGSGDNVCNGPTWIRPNSFVESNIFSDTTYWQFMGHTQFYHPVAFYNDDLQMVAELQNTNFKGLTNKFCYVDCLGLCTESVIFDSESETIEINRPD